LLGLKSIASATPVEDSQYELYSPVYRKVKQRIKGIEYHSRNQYATGLLKETGVEVSFVTIDDTKREGLFL
jgi:hypothetical protein